MKIYFLLLYIVFLDVCRAEPITLGTSFVIGAILSYYFSDVAEKIIDISICSIGLGLRECCGKPWIQADIAGLKRDLERHVFGQHIVQEIVPSALATSLYEVKPTKPLVLSFHGWPGGGKNYVTSFIAKNYFKTGEESKFYHKFTARINFPSEDKIPLYQEQLRSWIIANVSACPYSMFVFDEVDKMPAGILDGIKPFLDHHNKLLGIDFRRVIFIFLSNTGGHLITERYLELWRKYGKTREQMNLQDFDNVIGRGAFNEKGGLFMSDVIDHNLIDHYIPFLPLEKNHVELCIKAELEKYGYSKRQDIIKEVMEIVVFGPKPEALFSNTGCKRLSSKVATIVQRELLKGSSFDV